MKITVFWDLFWFPSMKGNCYQFTVQISMNAVVCITEESTLAIAVNITMGRELQEYGLIRRT